MGACAIAQIKALGIPQLTKSALSQKCCKLIDDQGAWLKKSEFQALMSLAHEMIIESFKGIMELQHKTAATCAEMNFEPWLLILILILTIPP